MYSEYDTMSTMLGGFVALIGAISLISLVASIIMIVSLWIIFKKAGKKGWEAIVPIYNIITLLQVVELPMWYIALFFVPIANIYAMFKIYIELAHKFGKSTGFGVATVFFSIICLPILAFSKNVTYNGNNSSMKNNTQTQPYNPGNGFAFQDQTMNVGNSMNANPQQPIMFNQNISTEINPIATAQLQDNNMNNQINPVNLNNGENSTIVNMTPNVIQTPIEGQTTNNFANPNQDAMPTQENVFRYEVPTETVTQQPEVLPSQPVEAPQQVIPQTVEQPQVTFNQGIPNVEQNNPGQPINVIPGINTMQQPMMPNQNNNPNNQNM